jgi:arylsulfatase B
MSGLWRLVNGTELYDIRTDPGQKDNLIEQHSAEANRLRAFYDAWWNELLPTFAQTTEIHLGHPAHPIVSLTGHDWIQEALPPWNQQHIRTADGYAQAEPTKRRSRPQPADGATSGGHAGHWAVKVLNSGRYRISLRRWPVEAQQPITAALPAGENVPGASVAFRARPGVAIPVVQASLRVDGRELAQRPVTSTDVEVSFEVELTTGSHQLAPVFVDAEGQEVGAYYAVISTL